MKHAAAALFVDVDGDGDEDLYVVTYGGTRHYLFINDGQGSFTEEGVERGVALQQPDGRVLRGYTPATGDLDGDGYPELWASEYVIHAHIRNAPSASRLLRNAGARQPGFFSDITASAGISRDDQVLIRGGNPVFNKDGEFVEFSSQEVRARVVLRPFRIGQRAESARRVGWGPGAWQ